MLINILVMQTLDTAFAALADPTRRAILARLALGEATVGELGEPFPISAPAISRHLKVLEEAALMDGAGYLKIFWRISLPQLRPALSNAWMARER